MIAPPIPTDDDARVADLDELELLGTPPEPVFDRLAGVAALIAGTPIALINLVGRSQQWSKAAVGLVIGALPRDVAFCAHAIAAPARPLIVTDTGADPRFYDHPLVVADPGIVAYAGFPLVSSGDHAIGALCVIDRVPRTFAPAQLDALRVIAEQIVSLLETRRAVARARRERDRYVRMFEDASDLIQGVRGDGTIAFANRAWRETLGYPSYAELSLFTVLAPEHRERCRAALAQLVRTGEPITLSTGFVTAAGARVEVEGRVAVWRDSRELVTIAIFRNVTAQRAAQAATRRARHTLDHAEDLAAIGTYELLHQDGEVQVDRWSNGLFDVLGYARTDTVDHADALLAGLAHDPAQRARVEAATSRHHAVGEPLALELRYRRPDGQMRDLIWHGVAERDGDRHFSAAGVIMDVTESRALDRLKTEFVSTVSHELRTPLASIRGALGLLEAGVVDRDEAAEMIGLARASTDRLIRLINGILDLDKMTSGRLELDRQSIEPRRLIEEVLQTLRPTAVAAGVALEVDVRVTSPIDGDRDRLIQVLTNLVGNAIKHSPAGAAITIAATPAAAGGGTRIAVIDRGPGVAPSHQARLFERFYQVDGSDGRRRGGTGLGLAISKAIIDAHGGAIGVRSQVGEGSEFWFEVRTVATDRSMTTLADLTRQSVIAVAPRAAQLVALRARLSGLGYRVLTFESLAELEAILTDVEVRAVVLSAADWPGAAARLAAIVARTHVIDPAGPDLEVRLRHRFRPPGPARVLVIDDDGATRRYLRSVVEALGAEVAEVAGGVEAIECARRIAPDLLILDLGLTDLDGFAVVDQLRQERLRTVPLVTFTVRDLSAAERQLLTLGPTRHVTKSASAPDAISTVVRELLGSLVAP